MEDWHYRCEAGLRACQVAGTACGPGTAVYCLRVGARLTGRIMVCRAGHLRPEGVPSPLV